MIRAIFIRHTYAYGAILIVFFRCHYAAAIAAFDAIALRCLLYYLADIVYFAFRLR